ncbi:alpha/beta hydrolase [Succinivibrio sp.]|uniref:alpha/beta hydrolase n=1 Tax=Succinivibrio sp. TaxID=2053619 RepID=UPI00386B1736
MKLNKFVTSMIAGAMLMSSVNVMANEVPVSVVAKASQMKNASVEALKDDTRVFNVDKSIEVLKVVFQNRYGFEVAGHLYLPKDFDNTKKYSALVITGPFGAVKEQSSGLYAQEMAKRGYVTVAFDPSMTGESSGVRRNMGSPEIFTEDYSAAVDFISNLTFVDPQKIGAIGICGLSGMAITAASNDVRIKAVVTSAMYDMSESISDHYNGAYYTDEQRNIVKQHLAKMRDAEAKSGESIRGAHELGVDASGNIQTFDKMFPDTLPADADPVSKDFYGYYIGRAYHPRAINSNTSAWDSTTPYGFFNFRLMDNIKELSPRPLMLITGDKAHSKYFSDNVYKAASSPKELIVVKGATHADLYDQMDKIPFNQIENFFNQNLK